MGSDLEYRTLPIPKDTQSTQYSMKSAFLPLAETMRSLVLVHFLVPAERVRLYLPLGLELQTYQTNAGEQAFVALVCYRAAGFRPALIASDRVGLPVQGINYRTYVRDAAGPAVYFFAVTTHQYLPWIGSRLLGAPTHHAAATFGDEWDRGRLQLASQYPRNVLLDAVECAETPLNYAPFASQSEMLHSLTDPLCGYLQHGKQIYRFDVAHPSLETFVSGEIRAVRVELFENFGILRGGERPHSLISARNVPFRLGLGLGLR